MKKVQVLLSLPDALSARMKAAIPLRQHSKVISELIKKEVKKRDAMLYECALAVESDYNLNDEMKEWDVTFDDGLEADKN